MLYWEMINNMEKKKKISEIMSGVCMERRQVAV